MAKITERTIQKFDIIEKFLQPMRGLTVEMAGPLV